MKKYIFLLIFFAPSILFSQITEKKKRLLDPKDNYVFVVAHRGDWRNAPENSLQAMDNCIKMGVDMVEIDLKMTKDSVLILMHDKTIDRTTNGKGRPENYTWEELSKLKLRNGAGHETIHSIPTFEECMLLCKDKILVNVDKGYNYFKEVYKILEKTGTINQCIIKSDKSYETVLAEQGDILSKVIFMPVINTRNPRAHEILDNYAKHLNPIAVEIVFSEKDSSLFSIINKLKQTPTKIWINSLWPELSGGHDDELSLSDPDQGYGYLIDSLGATLIQTDRPQYLIDYLHKRNNRKNFEPVCPDESRINN